MSTKRKAPAKLAAPVVKSGTKISSKSTIDESRTSVSGPDALQASKPETINISSDDDSDEDFSEEEDSDEEQKVNGGQVTSQSKPLHPRLNGVAIDQLPSPNHSLQVDEAEDDGADAEPTADSFGELLHGREGIDVTALLQESAAANLAAVPSTRTALVPPSHQSLTSVLSQALRSDDTDLLESCLHTTDLPTIRNTIEQIDSTLAGTLLNKLASRLYRRPGRAGNLMTWVQWTLIAHGGALASQPKVIHGLNGLQKVLAERAKGLNSLLALKGKLDLLEGQMDLRRKMQRGSGLLQQEDDEDDKDVIYVEGETDKASERDLANGIGARRKRNADVDSDDDSVPVVNGYDEDSEDEEEDDSEEDNDDDEAEESLDEDEVDYDDVDESMGEDEESDVDAAPPSKVQKVARSFAKKR